MCWRFEIFMQTLFTSEVELLFQLAVRESLAPPLVQNQSFRRCDSSRRQESAESSFQ